MRRNPVQLILAALVSSLTAAADTHIDAPMPPYCNPRGNWAECTADPPPASSIEFSTTNIADLVEFHPVVRKQVDREFGVAGGYAKLTLRWMEGEPEPLATVAVVSRRVLSSRSADQLASRFEETFEREGVLSVEIERYSWPWQRDPTSDWCELSREAKSQLWIVECGDE